MKTQLTCFKCHIEYSREPLGERPVEFFSTQINDDGAYNVVCPNGHDNFIVDNNLKYQLLFESGLYAFVDGYFRESISSVWASLERFYEYASKVILASFDVPFGEIDKIVAETYGASEKQTGGFYYLYSARFSRPLKYLRTDKEWSFRNKVIHKGYFPSEKESKEFITSVYNHITGILSDLNKDYYKQMVFIYGIENSKKSQKRNPDSAVNMLTAMQMPVCIGVLGRNDETGELSKNDLEKYIEKLREGK